MSIRSLAPILNVSSLPASFAWFESLGWSRGFSWNEAGVIEGAADRNAHGEAEFGSVCSGDAVIFHCLEGQGHRGGLAAEARTTGTWMSWFVDDAAAVDALHERCVELGYAVPEAPVDCAWGMREFLLRHPDGHTFRVGAGLGDSTTG